MATVLTPYRDALAHSPLFGGLTVDEIDALAPCLSPTVRTYRKGQTVVAAGDPSTNVGLVIAGSVQVSREGVSGSRAILSELGAGHLFGESYACAGVSRMPVTVTASADSTVLLVDYRRIFTSCSSACGFHNRLIENMVAILARKNIALSEKHEILSQRTTRDKLVAYLEGEAHRHHSRTFTIPFTRQELADYLGVDRSALWREMQKLSGEGVLEYYRDSFQLHGVVRRP